MVADRLPESASDFPTDGRDSLATVGERAVAKLIDLMVLGIPVLLLIVPFIEVDGDEARLAQPVWVTAVIVALFVAYDTLLVRLWGRTLGKRVLGLRVARLVDGQRPDWYQAALRVLLPASLAVIPVIGFVAVGVFVRALVDPLRQGFHDLVAATVVVRSG